LMRLLDLHNASNAAISPGDNRAETVLFRSPTAATIHHPLFTLVTRKHVYF